jgi:hypothetical protein
MSESMKSVADSLRIKVMSAVSPALSVDLFVVTATVGGELSTIYVQRLSKF